MDRLLAEPEDGSLKLYVTRSALRFRREHRALFAKGSYLPLRDLRGKEQTRNCFRPLLPRDTVLVLAGRFFAQLDAQTRTPVGAETWGDAEVVLRKRLPTGAYRDVFTGKTISPVQRDGDFVLPISEAFAHLPIAMLVNVESKRRGPRRCRVAQPTRHGSFDSAQDLATTSQWSSGSGRRM